MGAPMSVLRIPTLVLLAPLFVFGAILGFKRGMKAEVWTLAGLIIVAYLAARADAVMLPLLERAIGAVQRAGQVLLGRDTTGPAFTFVGAQRSWVALGASVGLILLAYSGGARLARGQFGIAAARVLGPLIGVINVALAGLVVVRRMAAVRGAQEGIAMLVPSFPGATVVVDVPSNPASLLAQWPLLVALMVAATALVLVLARTGRIGRQP